MTIFSKKLITNSLVINTIFLAAFSHNVMATTQEHGIEVKGQGSVMVEPDTFVLSIAITEEGRFTDKIRNIVDIKSEQVIKAAKNLGIKENNINSARVSLRVIDNEPAVIVQGLEVGQTLANNQKSKVYVGANPSLNNNAIQQNFELSRNITVNFTDIKDYDQFLNKVIKIGVSQISPLSMSIADTDKYYQQALVQAISNAKNTAQQIAKQTDQKLGKLIFVKELSSNHYRAQYSPALMSSNANYRHNSQVGEQTISANVLVKYSIE